MLQKGLIALLVLMLIVTVVFTSFGIAYNKSDFMSTMLKVERGLGDTSDKVLDTYGHAKNAFDEIAKFISTLKIDSWIEDVRDGVNRAFDGIRWHFAFYSEFGFNPLSQEWWNKNNFFYKLRNASAIKNVDGSYNMQMFLNIYNASKSGVLPDEFAYLEHQYNAYKKKCYADLLASDNYSLLLISYTSSASNDLQSVYSKICDSKVPFIVLKIPAVSSLAFDSSEYLGLFQYRDFITDMLTEFEYPVISSFKINITDLSLRSASVDYVRFAEISDAGALVSDSVSCRFRYDFSDYLRRTHNVLGNDITDDAHTSTPLLGVSFGYYDSSRKLNYFESGKIYLDYISQNKIGDFSIPDFGYAVPSARILPASFMRYDNGKISDMLN